MTSSTLKAFRAYISSVCEQPADLREALAYYDLSDYEVELVIMRLEDVEVPGEVG